MSIRGSIRGVNGTWAFFFVVSDLGVCVLNAVAAGASCLAIATAIAIAMSVAKRKHSLPRDNVSPKRSRSSPPPLDSSPPLLDLSDHVHGLGVKVLAFREKGLPFFTRLYEQRLQHLPEEPTCTAPAESKTAHEEMRQALKERLSVANEELPTLLAKIEMWNRKIQQAVEIMRKNQLLRIRDDQERGS